MNETKDFSRLELSELLRIEGFTCYCGKHHKTEVRDVIIGDGALNQIPKLMIKHGGSKAFLLYDKNTYQAAGEKVVSILEKSGIPFTSYMYLQEHLEPSELSVGQAAMNFDPDCDFIIGIGSGTLNDIGKILANITNRQYMIVGTAPSMDGFASNTSSMVSAGIKVTLPSACPVAIVADLDVISHAPMILLQAGLGDMLAKYVSICEWRISHLINDEYYCDNIASLVRRSLEKCVQSADGLPKRDQNAIKSILEGLILSGIAMGFAEVSRPASGVEHYFSHVWEMRAIEFGTNSSLHGIQVGIGTVLALKVYEVLRTMEPNKEQALEYVRRFHLMEHQAFLQQFLGSSVPDLIVLEQKEGKYDKEKHSIRLNRIIKHWDTILEIIREELPERSEVIQLLNKVGAPVSPDALGFSEDLVQKTFHATKDIRDKYIVSRLLWDVGMIDIVADRLI